MRAEIVFYLVDGETRKSHRTEYNDGTRIKKRAHKQEKYKRVDPSKSSPVKDQKSSNFGSLLFDPEELKKYVLDYLQSHGLSKARDPKMTDGISTLDHGLKSARRQHKHGDKSESLGSNNREKYKNNRSRYSHENDKKDYHSASKKKSKFLKIKKSRGYREDHDELEAIKKAKHHHGDDPGHINPKQRSNIIGSENEPHSHHSSSKRNLIVKKRKSLHKATYIPADVEKDFPKKKHSLSVLYQGVKEEGGRERSFKNKHSSHNQRDVQTETIRGSLHNRMHRTSRIHPRHYGNDWSFSKPDVGRHIYHDKNSNSVNRKLNERRKSSKRDFVAILPPESFNLEGFNVEKVHDKGRGKVGGGKKHQRAREDKPIKQSHKKQHKGERKSTLMLRSRGSHYGSTTSKLDKKDMKHPRILLKNDQGNPQVQEKSTQRKKSHVKFLKHSPKEDQVPRKKNIVTSKSLRNHGMGKDGREQRAASRRRKDNKKKSMVRQSSKKSHRHRGQKEDVKETKHNQRKTRRKVSTRTTSSKRRHRKEDHERGSKKFEVHSHEKSTVRKRKKASKQNSTPFKYSASWNSLEKRKIPAWYDDAKFGIFVHWGVYSVPSFDNEWFWYNWKGRKLKKYHHYVEENYPPGFSYNNFAAQFKAEFFNATQWAKLVASSGARYFVFTSKHHEGFANWNSSVAWNWNSVDIGPHRNIVDELAKAIRRLTKPRVRFGLYYSLYEWFNPHYLFDKASGFKTDEYVKAVVRPQLYDLVNTYKPDYLWADGEWEAKDTYWKSKEFLSWLYNESPVKDRVVVNDRWGKGLRCKHEVVCTGRDRYNPGKLQKKKWENAMTIDALSWGFRREANLSDFLSIQELIKQLVTTVSCGGNLLMNVGPASDGIISPIFQERLTQMGDWLKVNGDAIYKTRPWTSQNDSVSGDVWYTTKGKHVFAIALRWPRSGKMPLGDVKANRHTSVKLLGRKKNINWTYRIDRKGRKRGMVIHLPAIPVSDLPCRWAWVFKLSHLV